VRKERKSSFALPQIAQKPVPAIVYEPEGADNPLPEAANVRMVPVSKVLPLHRGRC
jgi:hypothetical protein